MVQQIRTRLMLRRARRFQCLVTGLDKVSFLRPGENRAGRGLLARARLYRVTALENTTSGADDQIAALREDLDDFDERWIPIRKKTSVKR